MEPPEYLGVDALTDRAVYRVRGRGGKVAVWDAATRCLVGFGFGYNTFTLTVEHHYDTAGRFGTAQPFEPALIDGQHAHFPDGEPLVEVIAHEPLPVVVPNPDLFEPLLALVARLDDNVARWAAQRAARRPRPARTAP